MINLYQLLATNLYGSILHQYRQSHSINLINLQKDDDGTIYFFSIPSLSSKNTYMTIIKIFGNLKSDGNCKCQCRCNCDSFKYQHMVRLYRNNSLYGDKPPVLSLPKKVGLLTGCKHTAAAAQELLSQHYNK